MSYNELCRTCLQEIKLNSISIFSNYAMPSGDTLNITEMIKSCTSIEVCNDDLPKNICIRCYAKLIEAYQFQLLCKTSYQWLIDNESKLKSIKIENVQSPSIKVENEQLPSIKEFIVDKELSENLSCNNNDISNSEKNLSYDNQRVDDNCILETKIKIECEDDVNKKLTNKINHKKRHSSKKKKLKTIKCHLCPKMFAYYYLLKGHLESHTNDKNYYCSICQKNVNKKLTNKINHKKRHSSKKKKLKTIKCHLCPKMFAYYYLLKGHLESHTNDKNYYCSICQKNYKSQTLHEKTHLLGRQFICDICSKKFPTKAKIRIHIQTHSNDREKLYKCKMLQCGKAYFTMKSLERHELCHLGTKNFMCHLCSKTFVDKAGLECHLEVHGQDKKYSCRTCNEKFQTSSKRYSHELRRHKERNVSCSLCGKMFYTKTALRRHMLIHTNEKRYKCSFCSTSYSRSDNKKRHEFTVHNYIGNEEKFSN